MYRFASVGMSALIAATSVTALRTSVLPGWLGRFPVRHRRIAAHPGPTGRLAVAALDNSGLPANACRSCRCDQQQSHRYRALFSVGESYAAAVPQSWYIAAVIEGGGYPKERKVGSRTCPKERLSGSTTRRATASSSP